MNSISFAIGTPALLSAMPSGDIVQAQIKAGAVGGALLGTLIGIGVGLMWLALTRKKAARKEKKQSDLGNAVELKKTKAKKKSKQLEKKQPVKVSQPQKVSQLQKVSQPAKVSQPQQVGQPQKVSQSAKTSQQQKVSVNQQSKLQQEQSVVRNNPVLLKLVDVELPHQVLEVIIEDQVIVGRHKERCGIVLVGDDTVSGVHCKIYNTNGKLFLIDLASTNGTFINTIKADKIMNLKSEDILKIGAKNYKIYY